MLLNTKVLNGLRELLGVSDSHFRYECEYDFLKEKYVSVIKGYYSYEEIFIELYPESKTFTLSKALCPEDYGEEISIDDFIRIYRKLKRINWDLLKGDN